MIRRPPRSTHCISSAASDVYKRQLYDGAIVPEYYDSLVAKIATQGLDRTQVIERMRVALSEVVIEGVKTTIPVHHTILENRSFLQGNYHVQFLDKMLSGWKPRGEMTPSEIAAVFLAINRTITVAPQFKTATEQQSRWRSGIQEPQLGKQPLYVEGV